MAKKYWLFKSEPRAFSIDDLNKSSGKRTYWDGIRNYQARNFIRDDMRKGDGVLFYHSNADPLAVVGFCEIVKEGYPEGESSDEELKKNNGTETGKAQQGVNGRVVREPQRQIEYDDDIVARQLREAAEKETDLELKEKLWQEYEEYKKRFAFLI